MQFLEQSKPFAGIRRDSKQTYLHTCFQILICLGHVLSKGLFSGGEKQQAPLLNLAPAHAPIIGPRLAGAVAEHVDRFTDDSWVAHPNLIEHQQSVRVRRRDTFQGVVRRAPGAHQTRPTPNRGRHLQMGGLSARAITVQVETARFMPKQVQYRSSKSHAHDERQAVVPNAQRADLLLPLLECSSLGNGRELGASFVEVQVFSAGTNLPIRH
ncbi:hypothetical protein D3C79_701950 [compost metagenome]